MEDLSNEEIRVQLLQYGIIPGPITETTRNVYEKKLKRVRESDDYQTPSQSPKRKKVESSPSLSTPTGRVRKRSASSPRLSRPRTRTPSPKPSAPPHPSLALAAPPSPLHVHHDASSSSVDHRSTATMNTSSSFSPVHHPKLACSQNDLQSAASRVKKRIEPPGLGLAYVLSSTVQSGLQLLGDSVKKIVNPILNAASSNLPSNNQEQHRNIPYSSRASSSRAATNQSPLSRVNRSPSSRVNQPPLSRGNRPHSSRVNQPSSSFARFNSIEIGGELEDELDDSLTKVVL